jgi:tetratricopeptide (TPR) repeat protein
MAMIYCRQSLFLPGFSVMKNLLYLWIVFFAACNNQEEKTTPANTGVEEQLISNLAQYPDSVKLLENLTQHYRDNDEYAKALQVVNNALKKDSSVPAYWHIKGVLHYENNDTTQAIHALEKSTLFTKDLSDMLLLAKLYADTKNTNAITLSNSLIAQNVFVKEALFIKGVFFKTVGDQEKALLFFDEAIATNYTFVEAYLEKAKVLYDQQQYMEALQVLDRAVKIKSNFAEGYYYMGRCFEKLERKEDAIESYQTALIYKPAYTEATAALKALK